MGIRDKRGIRIRDLPHGNLRREKEEGLLENKKEIKSRIWNPLLAVPKNRGFQILG